MVLGKHPQQVNPISKYVNKIKCKNTEYPVSFDSSEQYAREQGGRLASIDELRFMLNKKPQIEYDEWAAVRNGDHSKYWVEIGNGQKQGHEVGKYHKDEATGKPTW